MKQVLKVIQNKNLSNKRKLTTISSEDEYPLKKRKLNNTSESSSRIISNESLAGPEVSNSDTKKLENNISDEEKNYSPTINRIEEDLIKPIENEDDSVNKPESEKILVDKQRSVDKQISVEKQISVLEELDLIDRKDLFFLNEFVTLVPDYSESKIDEIKSLEDYQIMKLLYETRYQQIKDLRDNIIENEYEFLILGNRSNTSKNIKEKKELQKIITKLYDLRKEKLKRMKKIHEKLSTELKHIKKELDSYIYTYLN